MWVKPSSYVPPEFDPPFGKGLDAIQLIEIPLGPDVGISPGEASLSTPYPQEEDVVTIRVRVRNVGTRDVESVSVGFYLDSVEPGNLVDSASISNLRYQRLNLVAGQWISDGQAHTIIVFADNDLQLPETNEENNTAAIPIIPIPPPAGLTVAPNLAQQSLVLSWDSPQTADPAAPQAQNYRVYREDTPDEFVQIAETTGTIYSDDTVTSGTYQVTAVTVADAESPPAGPVSAELPPYGDADADGIGDPFDNCPSQFNPFQEDVDEDGVGDVCDPCPLDNPDDTDGEGVCDSDDICPGGDDNIDTDSDGVPDFCDPCPADHPDDTDGDGVCNSDDNCPDHANSDQADCDEDGVGDVCAIADGSEDCNENAVPDECDIADGDSPDDNGNGIPDECECPADLSGDGVVEAFDLAILLGAWGPCPEPCVPGPPASNCTADLSGDCLVEAFDLALLLGTWGPCQ